MSKFDIVQQNNIKIGNYLAAEIPASSPELRAFVVINAYIQTPLRHVKPSKFLNAQQEDLLRFRFHKYEVEKQHLENKNEISERQLKYEIVQDNIQSIDLLEEILENYLQDFSLLIVAWKFEPHLPFM